MWTTWAFLILLPAPSGGRELGRFKEEENVESEAEEAPLEISWRPSSRVKRENKVSEHFMDPTIGLDVFSTLSVLLKIETKVFA